MTSFSSVAFREVASKDERVFDEEQLPDESFDEADDELVIVEVEDRKYDEVSDDEETPLRLPYTVPLTAPTSKKHGQDKTKPPLSKGNSPLFSQCHQNEKELSPLLKSSSRLQDDPPLELSPHFGNTHVRTPRSTTVTSNLSPRRVQHIDPDDAHFSGIDRTASQHGPGSALDPNRSRADNQNKCASVSQLPAFNKETGSALSVPSGETSASSRPLHATGSLDSNTVKPWPSTGPVDLTGHRNVPALIKDRPLQSSHGGTVTSFPVIGLLDLASTNCNQHGRRPLDCATDHRRLSNNYIPVSGEVSDISSSSDRNELRHGSLADHLDVRSQQHLLDSRKSPNIVVDIKDNLVDKNYQGPIMGDGVILESYTALDPKWKNDHSINGYLDTNKNGPTKDISLDGEKQIDHSNGKVFSEVEDKEEADDGGPCGWGLFRFDFCQRFRSPAWFLVVLTLCGACQGMAVNGFVNTVISTIEKRYEISSTESGLIASCYDIVFVLLVIPVSYFGGHGHKPRYLGISILILGIGSFVFALPHFISGSYIVDNADDTVCKLMSNSSHRCASSAASSLSNYKYFFFLGQGLHGAGATALYTLGVTYIDENVPQRVSSFYNGIFYTGAIIGPAIGYMVGAEFLNIYTEVTVDPTTLGLDTSNPKWVGAWWIGFLISGVFGVLLSLPLLAYPSSLPGSKKYALERGKEAQAMKSTDVTGKSLGLKDCLLSIKLLLTNIPFMFINLAAAADGVLVAGFSTFMPKFIEYQFGVSAGTAALYVGLAVVPAGGGATFAGGFIVRLFNLKVRGILRLCTIMSFVLFALAFSLLMECDTGPFAGVTLSYGQTDVSNATFMGKALNNSCNQKCGCAEEDYFPMCGRDNVMYFSPCYAGCTSSKHDGKSKMYYNCSCVNYNVTDEDWALGTTHMGVFGKCEYKCQWLTVFMILFTFMIVFVFITSMPSLTATLRCVPDHQRSFGLGIQWIVARCLGSIPGPILFGKMFDLACLVWQKRCDGEGSCFFYDNHNMSINLMVLALVFSLIAALTFLIALCFYKVKSDKVTVEVNGSSKEDKSKEGINLQDLSLHKDTGVSLKDSDFIYQANLSRPEHDSR